MRIRDRRLIAAAGWLGTRLFNGGSVHIAVRFPDARATVPVDPASAPRRLAASFTRCGTKTSSFPSYASAIPDGSAGQPTRGRPDARDADSFHGHSR